LCSRQARTGRLGVRERGLAATGSVRRCAATVAERHASKSGRLSRCLAVTLVLLSVDGELDLHRLGAVTGD
jgi:hypothetical protein